MDETLSKLTVDQLRLLSRAVTNDALAVRAELHLWLRQREGDRVEMQYAEFRRREHDVELI
jgi:hypothetical protein